MFAFASGQTRVATVTRARRTRLNEARVRANARGLFFVSALLLGAGMLANCSRPDPHALAAADDRAEGTGLYTWLVEHDPSALVAWHVSPAKLRPLAPDARTLARASVRPCADAIRLHAALVLIASSSTLAGRHERDAALDCGIALYRDDGGLVIAPR